MNDEERYEQGMQVRREVLGEQHVARAIARTDDFTRDFQDYITRNAWGDIWSRPGLRRRDRSLITVALLAALQHEAELAMHIRAALKNGVTRDEISEILLQVGLYAGVPTANRAFAVAQEVLSG
jgi:4-carboxymuconolactone decarboxylase